MAAPHDYEFIWTLQSSHRLTPRVSLHTFARSGQLGRNTNIRPSGKVSLQFPPDLDPIAGSHSLGEEDRRLDFTPCRFEHDASGNLCSFAFLASNGRVAGLIGLPRPQGQLTARLVDVGNGFPDDVLALNDVKVYVAGGTGIACFLSLVSGRSRQDTSQGMKSTLICSIRGDDFQIIDFFLEKQILNPHDWSCVRLFITSGDDVDGLTAGKPAHWWQAHFGSLRQQFPGPLEFCLGRMSQKDLDPFLTEAFTNVLFCGSKSLEWQIKMWSLGRAAVHCTER
ncbi:hypothetical protein BGZ61DRAFT_534786 [Ilyonectria robusta]|uniref:uncharacterized protein n=1 Tax=Ilyonectria robusta TaxID=1079257 RepID=UPI001E8E5709|nr:uncharacterized protein BGZ61DRAFT_534786 [Ilyonectria robusta]KAH8684113.1 hypothetical protein BGZ61DRAFT_534786 [Ilyonectria robusta]